MTNKYFIAIPSSLKGLLPVCFPISIHGPFPPPPPTRHIFQPLISVHSPSSKFHISILPSHPHNHHPLGPDPVYLLSCYWSAHQFRCHLSPLLLKRSLCDSPPWKGLKEVLTQAIVTLQRPWAEHPTKTD